MGDSAVSPTSSFMEAMTMNGRARSRQVLAVASDDDERDVHLTGPDLIDRIVRAIELNQSVLLAGPRGCGKSYCIKAAVKEAQRRGILTIDSDITCQGNREVPRDYLFEDDVVFEVQRREVSNAEGGLDVEKKVVPKMKPAPLFRFADRDENNEPLVDPATREVQCVIKAPDQEEGPLIRKVTRFSLFLDEINRFSDGVLDGLLSVLEGQEAYLRGSVYRLPVVVLMTMNPPGYDATARNLSPPLAARISRSYYLYSPDIDTLSDIMIKKKMEDLQSAINNDHHQRVVGTNAQARVVNVPPILRRRAALATLLLWGHPNPTVKKPGLEYLTAPTRELMQRCIQSDESGQLETELTSLSALCRFGPDGRAASDWLVTATAFAMQQAGFSDFVTVTDQHCIGTAIEAVSHKIYDDFSPATNPDKVAEKERAVNIVCEQVMNGDFDEHIERKIDSQDFLDSFRSKELVSINDSVSIQSSLIYTLLTQYRITTDELVKQLVEAFERVKKSDEATRVQKLKDELSSIEFVVKHETKSLAPKSGRQFLGMPIFSDEVKRLATANRSERTVWSCCLCDADWQGFFVEFAKLEGVIPQAIRSLLEACAAPRVDYRYHFANSAFVSTHNALKVDHLVESSVANDALTQSEFVARTLDRISRSIETLNLQQIGDELLSLTSLLGDRERLSVLYVLRDALQQDDTIDGSSLTPVIEEPFTKLIRESLELFKNADAGFASSVIETIRNRKALWLARSIRSVLDYISSNGVNSEVDNLIALLASVLPTEEGRNQLTDLVLEIIQVHRASLGLRDGFDQDFQKQLASK